MKKLLFISSIAMIVFISQFFSHGNTSTEGMADQDLETIPDDAIRLRILANSDGDRDQELKSKVRDAVNEEINEWVETLTDIERARHVIEEGIPDLEEIVEDVLRKEDAGQSFDIAYEEDVTFPAKIYGSYLYPAGEYESVLITLGEGKGSNWWCVLFPPLCFLDFSGGTSVAETTDSPDESDGDVDEATDSGEAEVKFFLWEWLGLS